MTEKEKGGNSTKYHSTDIRSMVTSMILINKRVIQMTKTNDDYDYSSDDTENMIDSTT